MRVGQGSCVVLAVAVMDTGKHQHHHDMVEVLLLLVSMMIGVYQSILCQTFKIHATTRAA